MRKVSMSVQLFAGTALGVLAASSAQAQSVPVSMTSAPAAEQASAISGQAPQQSAASGGGVSDIIVTAERRSQNLQRVPSPISAVAGETIARADLTTAVNLTRLVPAVQISPATGAYTVFFVRGIGSNATNALAEPAVAFSLNDVFISRAFATSGQFFDLQRVEVVKGPQGTLYGRNATAGAINLIPTLPSTSGLSADLGATIGNYGTLRTNGAVNVPLSDTTAVRASFQTSRHSGYVSDGTGDDDSQGGRVILLTKPSSDLSIQFMADYFHQGGKGGGYTLITGFSPSQRVGITDPRAQAYLTSQGFAPVSADTLHNDNENFGISAKVQWQSPLGELTVIPAYRSAKVDTASTQPLVIRDHETDYQKSVEARLASTLADGALKTIVGTYVLNDPDNTNSTIDQLSNAAGGIAAAAYRNKTSSVAVFGDANYSISSRLRILGGVRYTSDRKELVGTYTTLAYPNRTPTGTISTNSSQHFGAVTWRAGAEFDVGAHSLLYATASTGYHSGGFYFTHDNPVYQPEHITAYTIGSKNRFFDGRLQANFELYDWEYSNQQISHITQDSTGATVFATDNAGKSHARGVDADLIFRPGSDTTLGLQVQYLDAKLDSYTYQVPFPASASILCQRTTTAPYTVNCAGMRPPQAPEWTINGNVQKVFALPNSGDLTAGINVHYQTSTITAINYLPNDVQSAYATGDLSLAYAPSSKAWTVTGFVDNVTNRTIVAYTQHLSNLVATGAALRPPRTYGVRLEAHFK